MIFVPFSEKVTFKTERTKRSTEYEDSPEYENDVEYETNDQSKPNENQNWTKGFEKNFTNLIPGKESSKIISS